MDETLPEKIMNKLSEKIKEANLLVQNCSMLSGKNGYKKLLKKIEAELKFLHKLGKHPDRLKEEHLRSSNLYHLASIVNCSLNMEGVVEILKPYTYVTTNSFGVSEETKQNRIVVDVVADHGKTWVKVVARNPQALLQSSLGTGSFGRRTLCEQIEDFLACAAQNFHLYQPPNVKVWFAAGITNQLKKIIENMGVEVLTQSIHDDFFISIDDDETEESEMEEACFERTSVQVASTSDISINEDAVIVEGSACSPITDSIAHSVPLFKTDINKSDDFISVSLRNSIGHSKEKCSSEVMSPQRDECGNVDASLQSLIVPDDTVINLDVSTMIAYVSSLTNGGCNYQFEEAILTSQAARERLFPVKIILDKIFEGHQLVCCETAYKDFQTILATVGGEGEKQRAAQLLAKVQVVPDQPSKYAFSLHTNSKVRKRSQIIFGTGDTLKALTVTANGHFLRAAESQGIKFVAFVHESRALTEAKQKTVIVQ